MNSTRRNALRFVAGSAVLLAAAGGTGAFWLNKRANRAIAPWAEAAAGAFADWRMKALAYAVLAPNPHNRQPWLLELRGTDMIRVYCELDRRLPVTDPFDRQIMIGFGAFLELLRMAAAQDGVALAIETFPEGLPGDRLDRRPIAALRPVGDSAMADPLFAHVLERHTNRQPYRTAAIPDEAVAMLRSALPAAPDFRLHMRGPELAALRDITIAGFDREMRTPQAHLESVHLMRIGRAEIDANPDGIALDGPMIEFARLAGLVSAEALADPDNNAFRQGVDKLLASAQATPAFVSLCTTGNSREDQLDAGRDWIRLHLAATGLGLAMQPMSQALQEYPEMADLNQAIHTLLRPDGGRIQMLGRIGYAPAQRPAPRWPVSSRLLDA